jgi:hypothetical protein
MKKKIYLLAITMLLCFTAFNSYAVTGGGNEPLTKEAVKKMTPDEKKERLQELKARMLEIESIDKSKMSKEDRKALREEMKSLRHDSNAVSGGGLAVEVGGGVIILVLVGLLSGV